jgi:hypothetical protein
MNQSNSEPKFIENEYKLEVTFDDIEYINTLIQNFNKENNDLFKFKHNSNKSIWITINNNYQRIFFKKDHLLKALRFDNLNYNFCFIEDKEKFYIYFHDKQEIYFNKNLITLNNIVTNSINYLRLKELLKIDLNPDNFCTFNDFAGNKIIILVPNKGKLEIGYSNSIPDIPNNINLKEYYNLIVKFFEKQEFIPFFKNEVYDTIKSNNPSERFFALIINIHLIFENAKEYYELYLSGFSVSELINKLREDQLKYFSAFREIINKIFSYSFSVPISITATLIGMLNVKNNDPFILLVIALSFIMFTIISIYYQCYLFNDIKLLEKDIENDKSIINKKLIKPKAYIDNEFDKVYRKISSIKYLIIFILSILVLFVFIIIFVAIYLIANNFVLHLLKGLFG